VPYQTTFPRIDSLCHLACIGPKFHSAVHFFLRLSSLRQLIFFPGYISWLHVSPLKSLFCTPWMIWMDIIAELWLFWSLFYSTDYPVHSNVHSRTDQVMAFAPPLCKDCQRSCRCCKLAMVFTSTLTLRIRGKKKSISNVIYEQSVNNTPEKSSASMRTWVGIKRFKKVTSSLWALGC
jgi:hypothetical protein